MLSYVRSYGPWQNNLEISKNLNLNDAMKSSKNLSKI